MKILSLQKVTEHRNINSKNRLDIRKYFIDFIKSMPDIVI